MLRLCCIESPRSNALSREKSITNRGSNISNVAREIKSPNCDFTSIQAVDSLEATYKYETPARLFRPTPLIPKIVSREFISLYPLNLSSLNLPIPVSTFFKVFNRHSKFFCRIHDCLLYLLLLPL